MGRKFGKKNKIKLGVFDYNVGLIGESGIGKTTLAIEACEQLVGEDGYLLLSLGKEDAVDAIPDAVFEEVPDWATFDEITSDIIENKNTDYKDLKVIIYDTLDELFKIAEPEVIRLWNKQQTDATKKVTTVSASWGGFQRGEDKAIEIILEKIWELKKVGVSMFFIGHTKRRSKIDPVTSEEYDVLTTNMMSKYFEGVKTKLHVLGVASIDRTINKKTVKDKIGKTKTVGEIAEERRIITFRDDNFTIESKSRFDEIVPQIKLDTNEFIKAIDDAIIAKHNQQKNKKSVEETKVEQEKEREEKLEKVVEEVKTSKIDVERNIELIKEIKVLYGKASDSDKEKSTEFMKEQGASLKEYDTTPTIILEEVVNILS
ncbi:ATP-binding protein [Ureibacillus chungkukjangi]|uniref:AAA family ATPase n=1 Tax=Ureibacillus chungkukjangi TaxID=1202712 RepID=UPI0020423D0B|nr:AAA family ATPase [Ureibacillus chungkukjangi]MCM3387198.1 ATP-binding protein [Ureibacillus chungkukjangi]